MKKYISLAIMLNLLSGKRYTAPCLAEKYETSIKTIYRCIDSLIMAGMPIVSIAGKNGGYELVKDSLVLSSFLTTKEMGLLIGFLKSSGQLVGAQDFSLDERLNVFKDKHLKDKVIKESGELVIDTSTWGTSCKDSAAINALRGAISDAQRIQINYFGCTRTIEPYTLVYKSGAWYVYAFCLKRNSFRMFKLSRIKELTLTGEQFEKKDVNILSKPWNREYAKSFESITLSLVCKKDIMRDVLEWLDDGAKITSLGENVCICSKASFSLGLVHRLMEYGDKVKVVEPEKLRLAIVDECTKIARAYN